MHGPISCQQYILCSPAWKFYFSFRTKTGIINHIYFESTCRFPVVRTQFCFAYVWSNYCDIFIALFIDVKIAAQSYDRTVACWLTFIPVPKFHGVKWSQQNRCPFNQLVRQIQMRLPCLLIWTHLRWTWCPHRTYWSLSPRVLKYLDCPSSNVFLTVLWTRRLCGLQRSGRITKSHKCKPISPFALWRCIKEMCKFNSNNNKSPRQ